MASKESTTPSKTSTSIQYTPTRNKRLCVLCGKREENDNYRVKLSKNNEKNKTKKKTHTSACNRIDKYLGIHISPLLHVDSLCKNCHRSVLTLQTKSIKHQTNYQRTIETLKKTHGKTSKKRLPFSEVSQESK